MQTQAQTLGQVARWHAERAVKLCTNSKYEKNKDKYDGMLREAGRHFSISDEYKRQQWMENHRQRQKK